MLVIRREQMDVLRASLIESVIDRIVRHVQEVYPEQCRMLGEERTRDVVEYGRVRSAEYGLFSNRDVCKYVDIMFAFGRDFDVDPALPWAAPVLAQGDEQGGPSRIERLVALAMANITQARGIVESMSPADRQSRGN